MASPPTLLQAEAGDQDHDGIPTWQEYLANTNPTNAASKFVIFPLSRASDGRNLITFTTSTNRTYRVESSTNLVNWITVQDFISGINTNVTVTDPSYTPGALFYRVLAS